MQELIDALQESFWWCVAALTGGIIDWLNQTQKGTKDTSFTGLFVHLASALFFGWVAGNLAGAYVALYAGGVKEGDGLIGAAGALGGYMGIRFIDWLGSLKPKS